MSPSDYNEEIAKHCGVYRTTNLDGKHYYDGHNYVESLEGMREAADYLRNSCYLQYTMYIGRLHYLVSHYNAKPEQQAYHPIDYGDAPANIRADAFLYAIGVAY